ncbi:translation initiation factor IF-2 N-terminal domain-containing protein [Mycobacterium hodleri]|nr:translation initiation factor IF-2 N-terminal domain-containing protein [Mycolicibacterium hodleri]
MRLDPPPKHAMRVHELAKELGWPPSQLVDELRSRGEWVTSAMSTLEAPVVRAVRRDFAAAIPKADPEETLQPALYGDSADLDAITDMPDETFAEALARIKSEPPRRQMQASSKENRWRPPVLQALLDEVISQRPEHLSQPSNGHFGWEMKKAEQWHVQWAKACLNGLADEDPVAIEWIRLSGGQRPHLAVELSRADITPDEAGLRLGYNGRIDPRMDTLYARFRDRRISRSEVIVAVRQWRQNNAAG